MYIRNLKKERIIQVLLKYIIPFIPRPTGHVVSVVATKVCRINQFVHLQFPVNIDRWWKEGKLMIFFYARLFIRCPPGRRDVSGAVTKTGYIYFPFFHISRVTSSRVSSSLCKGFCTDVDCCILCMWYFIVAASSFTQQLYSNIFTCVSISFAR